MPVDVNLYESVMMLFKKALGLLYDTDYYIAKKPEYHKQSVFFDRFCFDIISLLGEHLTKLSFSDVEYIMRKVYQHSTHFIKGQIKMLQYECIISPFSPEKMSVDPKLLEQLSLQN